MFARSVHRKAIDLIRMVVEMTTEAGSGHPSSAASLAHIVTVLLYDRMQFEPLQPDHPAADRLVLSEGHACPIVYAAGADLGFALDTEQGRRPMEVADLQHLREAGSPLAGHPNPAAGFPFFPSATGSLGQGLSIAAGIALAARMDASDRRIYCIVGDGESREGQVWEALDLIVDRGLTAVCPIFNCNGRGQTGEVSPQQSAERLALKLQAFGFDARVVDGHDPDALRAVFAAHQKSDGERPVAIVAQTTKGWGSSRMQGDMHGKALDGSEAEAALEDLEGRATELQAELDPDDLRRHDAPSTAPTAVRDRNRPPTVGVVPTFEEALASLDRGDWAQRERMATRQAHGAALQMLGRMRPDVVVLDGDVANSTHAELFAHDDHVNDRFVQCRIGEQNMLSCGAGLAAAGKVPFVSTFGKFMVRAFDQLEMALIGGNGLKLVGSHCGVTAAADGPSQMALADVAFCRALTGVTGADGRPVMHVLTPCDARSAYALTMLAAEHDGSFYLRTQRPAVPHVYGRAQQGSSRRADADEPAPDFRLGGANVLVQGEHLVLFTCGYMVHVAAESVRRLAEDGIRATLVDAYCLPVDRDRVAELVAANGGRALCVEDNYNGGLGSAVAEAVADAGRGGRVLSLTVTRHPESAREPEQVLSRLGLGVDDVTARARELAASG